jgi:hypothetical protein
VAVSIEQPESEESTALALGLSVVVGLQPTGLAGGSFARPFSLGRCFGFHSPLLGHDFPIRLLEESGRAGQVGLEKCQFLLSNYSRTNSSQKIVISSHHSVRSDPKCPSKFTRIFTQTSNEQKELTEGRVRRRRETSSRDSFDHSFSRNAFLEIVNVALN